MPQNAATYEKFADTIEQVTASAWAESLRAVFGSVVLKMLVGNIDDHRRTAASRVSSRACAPPGAQPGGWARYST